MNKKFSATAAGGAYIARFAVCAIHSKGTIPLAEVGGDA